MKNAPDNIIGGDLILESIPFNAAIIDRDYNIVAANQRFRDYFGPWQGMKCHSAYKKLDQPCLDCPTAQTFKDGVKRVIDGNGTDANGRAAHYVTHISPIRNQKGEIIYVLEMSHDITESKDWLKEYQILFERVPCYITVIDRDFKIIRANEKFRETFGSTINDHCFKVYKHRSRKCNNCPAARTFKDGQVHSSEQVGITKTGERTHYYVTTAPLSRGEDKIAHVIEISTDVTRMKEMEQELQTMHAFQRALIRNSSDGILASDVDGQVTVLNPAARNLLGHSTKSKLTSQDINKFLPGEFIEMMDNHDNKCVLDETVVVSREGEEIPVRLSGATLKDKNKILGYAAFLQDLRDLKKLEREKLDAERLSAVGQTVAGLAHTIKNILMGLEGGMYMVHSGLNKNDRERTTEGWEILEKNFDKITSLVKDFLSFAKGRLPEVRPVDPNKLITEIVELYYDTALQAGIELICETDSKIGEAPIDPDGIHTCLTNLVSNAIDACMMSEKKNLQIVLAVHEKDDILIFEVSDNGMGMDYNIKQKLFTTFFTTKGGGGTGLGLLTTRKIVQEHGGQIEFDSEEGKGSLFRICLPRKRLMQLYKIDKKSKAGDK